MENYHQENSYINLIKKINDEGNDKPDRTGLGVKSIFGEQLKFNLKDSFPLLTHKKVFFRGVCEELLWFIRGDTDSKILSEKGVKIWDDFGKRDYLDKLGLNYEENHLGPIYSHQWRHFNAKYEGANRDYANTGVDQLANVINELKINPNSRRLFVSAWNPCQIKEMALPPCHVSYQFYVNNNEISCHMYQRSCDILLGLPFNIASYALLTYMIGHICGYTPKELIISLGDIHIYKNQLENEEGIDLLLSRKPFQFPKLKINRKVHEIEDFKFEDFELIDYQYHPHIKFALNS
jgi:thymidylate synthase